MARPHPSQVDPAADAAALLRRLGFATLVLAVPLTAMVARRAVVVLAPIGIALLVIAALLDGDHDGLRPDLTRVLRSIGGLAGALLVTWMVLSLAWTPFRATAAERAFNVAATLAMVLAGYLAMPGRMRSANLYLAPIGAGAAAIAAIGLALSEAAIGRSVDEDGSGLERGVIVLVLVLWPALAWLRSRGRDLEALALAVAVVGAAFLVPVSLPLVGLAAGGLAFAVTAISPGLGVRITALAVAATVALAPLVPFILRPVAALALRPNNPLLASLSVWRRVVADDPLRLVTGRGFEAASRGRLSGLVRPNAPTGLPFEIWYDLGLVGALAAAVLLYVAIRAAGRAHAGLVPGAMAAFATGFALACAGVPTTQMWWFTTILIVALAFVAVDRGQFRTSRPKAAFSLPRR
ncbi:peptide ABC transporter permease [Salinarimonas soli]|uniref:Peptide ABC transporter permease n=1 Tax=Salinarimonas soli TaxID=1638099 RepID=A0A5B2V9X5_9HYPH|nr:peptide ABC transporter permease [Salinarimonas soli]KAA2235037.1 peptide ABC transporter permease [Salinarimonas soli]